MRAEKGLFVVADGVGGNAAGEVASALCVASVLDGIDHVNGAADGESELVLAGLEAACSEASRRVYEAAGRGEQAGMATTLVAVQVNPGGAHIAHVGDSRAYLIRGRKIHQLTEDHSFLNDLRRTGRGAESMPANDRRRHMITRAVGIFPTVQPSVAALELFEGDRLLLCTDGLTDVVSASRILELAVDGDLDDATGKLIAEALSAGGPDNVTVCLIAPEVGAATRLAEQRARMIETLFLFEDMPWTARLQIARILRVHGFARGDVLARQGEHGTSMFIVLEGQVSVRLGDLEIARMGPGEHVGELSLVDARPRAASVVAASAGGAISISSDALRAFVRREPELGAALQWKLLAVFAQRLRATNARIDLSSNG